MARQVRKQSLNERQMNLVIGSLLGDGHLSRTTRGFAFRVNHGLNEREYVDWKYTILRDFVRSSPKPSNNCYYFRTVSHPIFEELRDCFYEGKEKKVPESILQERLNSFILAVWIMDDGARERNQLRINSQKFWEGR